MAEIALVTGFSGYGGRARNPAGEAAKALDGRNIGGLAVSGRVLPVSYGKLQAELQSLIDEFRPRVIICLGLWPGEAMIRLERAAINLADFEIPDNEGALLSDLQISGNAATAIFSTLPLRSIEAALLEAGVPTRLSSSAGTFLCNATLYTVLAHADRLVPRPLAGFIHLPYLPEQVADLLRSLRAERALELHQRADTASMDFSVLLRAVTIAIEATAKSLA